MKWRTFMRGRNSGNEWEVELFLENNCQDDIEDLGVWFDGNLSFVENVDRVICKVAVLRFRAFDIGIFVWCMVSYKVHISRIESIPKKFLMFALRNL